MLTVYDLNFRNALIKLGMVYGRKSYSINLPKSELSEKDYFRGVIDGDGSLGLTSNGYPFVSLVTSSEAFAEAYLNFLKGITGKAKNITRNKRDGVFNIAIFKEDAQLLAALLYYPDCLALSRKVEAALKIAEWVRPNTMRKIEFERNRWTLEEDSYILTHTVEESAEFLQRTHKSIKVRLWRIRD